MGIDSRKAYTSVFIDIEYYPVFGLFDIWQKYDGHKVEDYTQYKVEVDPTKANPILFNGKYTRCYGYKLNRIDKEYQVLYQKRPSNLVMSNSKSLVKKVYETNLSIDLKKFIVNKNLGLIEKKYNKNSMSKPFKNYNEAFYYQTELNKGNIYSIHEEETVYKSYERDELMYVENGEEKYEKVVSNKCEIIIKDTLHILHVSKKEDLINGFLPIKELIYDIRDLKNYNTFVKLTNAKIPVWGIKTDSLIIEYNSVKKLISLFNIKDKIGNYKTNNYQILKLNAFLMKYLL